MDRIAKDALLASQSDMRVATATHSIIEALAPLKPDRRAKLMRFIEAAVDGGYLHLIRVEEIKAKGGAM